MTFIPLFATPCELAQRLPDVIAQFLQIEQGKVRRFREDTITDLIVACFLQMNHRDALVVTPPEVVTGGDFDLVITDPYSRAAVQYRIQAKRAHLHATWDVSSYKELAHPQNKGTQAAKLVSSSKAEVVRTVPLYAFYNPHSICASSAGRVDGISMASGRRVNQLVQSMVQNAPRRRPFNKRIGNLQPLFFPLSTLLCTSGPLSPARSCEQVSVAIEQRDNLVASPAYDTRMRSPDLEASEQESEAFNGEEPAIEGGFDRLPEEVKSLVERRGVQRVAEADIGRPKLVLVTGA